MGGEGDKYGVVDKLLNEHGSCLSLRETRFLPIIKGDAQETDETA